MLNKELLEILVCPICKSRLSDKENRLICDNCKKAYPIKDGIPIMMIDEAEDI